MIKLPEREDFLDYVEGAPISNLEVQKNILKILSSSQLYREQCAEIKRDLYLIESQIPEYQIEPELAAELSLLASSWLKIRIAKRYSFQAFTNTSEFFTVILLLGSCFIIIFLALVWLR